MLFFSPVFGLDSHVPWMLTSKHQVSDCILFPPGVRSEADGRVQGSAPFIMTVSPSHDFLISKVQHVNGVCVGISPTLGG